MGNGKEAIETVKSYQPDALVVDSRLEEIDGREVAGWVKDHAQLHRIPVILLVDPGELESEVRIVDCGAQDFLTKPIYYPELAVRLALRANNEDRFSSLFTGHETSRMAIQESVAAFLRQHRDREEEILSLMFTDPDTGLNNRAYFKIKLSEELKRAQRYQLPLSALLIKLASPEAMEIEGVDPDAGIPPSSLTLKEMASILLLESRDLDIIGRYGSSDFAMLLPNTLQDGAVLLAQRISERLIVHPFTDNAGGRDFQVRIGIASYPIQGVRLPREFMDRAYEALMKAENFGTKEICIWEARNV